MSLTITPPTAPVSEGSSVNLTCTATLNTTVVNTAVTASIVWTGPSRDQFNSNSSRVSIINMLQSSPYQSVIVFDPVYNQDSGQYYCNVTITSNDIAVLPVMYGATAIILGEKCHYSQCTENPVYTVIMHIINVLQLHYSMLFTL